MYRSSRVRIVTSNHRHPICPPRSCPAATGGWASRRTCMTNAGPWYHVRAPFALILHVRLSRRVPDTIGAYDRVKRRPLVSQPNSSVMVTLHRPRLDPVLSAAFTTVAVEAPS